MNGYANRLNAEAPSEIGQPRELPGTAAGSSSAIPGFSDRDGSSCYPLFTCRDFTLLADDLDAVEGRLVSFAAVVDPFGNHTPELLRRACPDMVLPLKEHFVVDLTLDPDEFVAPPTPETSGAR